jgi:hypothetical protein
MVKLKSKLEIEYMYSKSVNTLEAKRISFKNENGSKKLFEDVINPKKSW